MQSRLSEWRHRLLRVRLDRWTIGYFLTLAALVANMIFLTVGSPRMAGLLREGLIQQSTLSNVETVTNTLGQTEVSLINLALTGEESSRQELQNNLAIMNLGKLGASQIARDIREYREGALQLQQDLSAAINGLQNYLNNEDNWKDADREKRWNSIRSLRENLRKALEVSQELRFLISFNLNETSRSWQAQVQERNLAIMLTSLLGLILFGLVFLLRGQHEKKQREREQELRASYQFLQSTMDAMETNICILDEKGAIQALNASWERSPVITGFEAIKGVGQNYLEICGRASGSFAAEASQIARGIRDVLDKKLPCFYREYPCHGPDQKRWSAIRATGFTWKNEPRVVVAHENITDRILANEALQATQEQNQKLALVASRTSNAIIISDARGIIQWVNDGFTRLTGYHLEEMTGRRQIDVLSGPKTDPAILKNMEECIARGLGYDVEILRYSREKKPFWVQDRCEPIHDEKGQLTNFITIKSDVSERHAFIEDLTKAKQEAESANQAKSEFLANVSHEIRTPLNGVIGMTGLLLGTPLSPEQQDFVQTSLSSAQSLLTIINDILDYSKIEAGKLELHPESFSLRSFIHQTVKPFGLKAGEKGIELTVRVDDEIIDHLHGDSERLKQVLSNFLANALKFTSRGEIELNVGVESSRSDYLLLHFSVRDTGIGISQDKLEKIFRPFEQADGTTVRRFGGTGLGLSICSQLVAKMGGKIWVESQLGHGSTFHFTVKLDWAETQPGNSQLPPVDLAGLSALVIDDNATSRRILVEILSGWQMKPHAVASGPEGLAEWERARSAGAPYPFVLIDAGMPEMDGFAVAEKLQKTGEINHQIVMLLSSADPMGDTARCRERGVVHYLSKPINPEDLLRAIRDVQAPTDAPPPLIPIKPRKSGQGTLRPGGLKILLAEDNLVNQKVAQKTLARMGHFVVTVNNGLEALEAIAREPFDLVLMDVQMPEMDGLEATRQLRLKERGTGEHLHVIAITAHAMKGDRDRCQEAGMDDYITKPLQPGDLYRVLAESPLDASPWNYKEAMLSKIGGSEEMLSELTEVLLAEVPATMEWIRGAIAKGDGPQIGRASHKLKGTALAMGAQPIVELASKMEKDGFDGKLTNINDHFCELEQKVRDMLISISPVKKTLGSGPLKDNDYPSKV